jgi:sugar phosphate isomerase/epimerase
MIPAVSNISLPACNHLHLMDDVASIGYAGLEVAPSRIWRNTSEVTSVEISSYRTAVEKAGIKILGLHSLLYDRPDLQLFAGPEDREKLADFFCHLSKVCRDLGGRTLIFGGGRRRGDMPLPQATEITIQFFETMLPRISDHGTIFCFEPLGPNDSDFINSSMDSIEIAEHLNHPSFAVQLDAKALVDNDEIRLSIFESAASRLVHFHANQQGLGVLCNDGTVDHATLGSLLKKINYTGYVSVEQRMLNEDTAIQDIGKSMNILKRFYDLK